MSILVTGGSSIVARTLIPTLRQAGHEVISAGRVGCDVSLDLSAAYPIVFPEGTDIVIHLAAHPGGIDARSTLLAEHVNALGTARVCDAAARAGASYVVLVSTIFASLADGSPFFGSYALSKRHAEEIARLLCRISSIPLLILRPSRIVGVEDCRAHHPFVYSMFDKAEQGEDIIVFGSSDPIRNYIHLEDFVSVLAKAVEDRVDGTFACQYLRDTSYVQIAQAAFAAFRAGGKVCFAQDKPDVPDSVFPQDHSLYERIGIYPQISMHDWVSCLALARASGR